MPRKQTRRTISVSGATYRRIKHYCTARGLSFSGFMEELAKEKLDMEGVPLDIPASPPADASIFQVTEPVSSVEDDLLRVHVRSEEPLPPPEVEEVTAPPVSAQETKPDPEFDYIPPIQSW